MKTGQVPAKLPIKQALEVAVLVLVDLLPIGKDVQRGDRTARLLLTGEPDHQVSGGENQVVALYHELCEFLKRALAHKSVERLCQACLLSCQRQVLRRQAILEALAQEAVMTERQLAPPWACA